MKNFMLAINRRKEFSATLITKKLSIFFSLLLLGSWQFSFSQTTITSSAGGGNWSVTGSWTGGVIPGANDSVVISNGSITLTDARSCGSITIPSGKTLTINNNQTLTIAKTSAGSILGGYYTNNGTVTSGGSSAAIQMGTNGVIGGSAVTTIGQLRINTTNTTDIVTQNVSTIIISNGGTLFLTKGIFKVGAANTVQMGTSSGTTINATGGGNFAITGTNGSDGGNIDCRAGSGGTLTISGTGAVGSPTFYNVFQGSASDANWRFGCTTAGIKVNGTLSASTLAGGSVANANQWATTGSSPVYGPNSTLIVNRNGQGWTPSIEWLALPATSTIGTTPGYPNNVTLLNMGGSQNNGTGFGPSGTWSINGTLAIGNSTITGSATTESMTAFTCGGILIDNGSVLKHGTETFNVKGNWRQQGSTVGIFSPINTSSSAIIFNGTGSSATPQTISISTGVVLFGSGANFSAVTIAGGTYVKLNSPATIFNTKILTLTSGILETDATNVLSITNTATTGITGTGSATNCITGPVKWTLLNSGTNTYNFPAASGTATITYLPFTLISTNTTAANIATVQAFAGSFGGTADGTTLSSVSNTEYWSLAYSSSINTGSTISAGRLTVPGSLSRVGKSTTSTGTGAGSYSSIGGTVSGNNINNSTDIGTGTAFNFQLGVPPIPVITLADNTGGQASAANLGTGSTDNPIANFQLTVGTAAATLRQLTFTTTGTADGGDITNFKLYYSATNNFASRALVTGSGTTLTTGLGAGSHVFGTGSALTQSIPVGVGYFWITADVPGTAGADNLQVSAISPATNLVFTSGTPTGSTTQAGLQTIVVLPTVTTIAASSITTTGAVLNGTVNANGPAANNAFDWGVTQYNNNNVAAATNPVATGTGNTSTALSLSGLTANTLYNFRAKSDNGNPGSPVSGSNLTFTTLSNAPTVGAGSAPTSNGFTASWTAPGGQGNAAITYTVQVDNDPLFGSVNLTVTSLAGTSTVISNVALSSGTVYYFRVIAVNAGGNSAPSASSSAISTGDADADGAAPAVGNNINSIANQYLLKSRQRDRYVYDNSASNTVNGTAAVTLKFDNSSATPAGAGPNSIYAWYMTLQSGSNYSLQNVFTSKYVINGGGTPGDGYVGFVGGSCDTRNWNTISLVDATTFNGIVNANKKYFTRSVNATIYYQFASLYGATDGNYAGYFLNTDYTGTNNGNNATNVLGSGANCTNTRDFQFTTYTATPDLEVTGVSTNLSNSTAALNTAFAATATIRNNGLLAITNGTAIKVKFVLDGKIFTTTYSGGLAAGASTTLTAVNVTPAILTTGSPLVVTVNSNWTVAEYNYSNNSFSTANIAVLQPSMSVVGTLSAVPAVYGSGTPFTNYTVSGSSLVADIIVTAAAGFQVSQTSGTNGYASSQTLVPVSNTVPTTTIYVRLAPTSSVAGSPYAGNITNATAGIVNQNIATVSSTVSPAGLTITGVTANNKPYNGNTTATLGGAPVYVGLQNGESFAVTGSPVANFNNANAGTGKPVTITGYTAPNTNYTLTAQPAATANITPVSLTVTADNKSKNYDGSIYPGGYSSVIAGFVNGENSGVVSGTASYTGSAIAAIAAGSYTITPDVSGLSAVNYTFSPVNATLTINPVSQSLADFRSKTPGGNLSNPAAWEYNGGGGTWISATQKPGVNNNVEILHNITFDEAFTVGAGNTLKVTSGIANFAGQSVTFKSDASGTASLGQVLGTLSNATNVTVERFIPDNDFRSWRLLSVPTFGNGQTIRQAWQEGAANPLPFQDNLPGFGTQITGVGSSVVAQAAGFDSVAATASLLRWTGTAWAGITNTNTAIANFPAYFLFIRGDRTKGVTTTNNNSSSTTLRTNGTVYTGDQVNNIGANAFALVPNLYPSAINFTGLTRTGGVSNLFYTWDSKKMSGNSLGVYQTFSGTNSFNCMISGGSYTFGAPNTTIESGQGFFVQSTTAGTITLKETAKISGTNGSLGFRPSATPARIDTRLYNSNDEMLDANTVVFDAAYDKAVDGDDAPKYGNPGANFAIERQSKLLAIEGTQPAADKDVIRFRMWNLQQQAYKLEIAAIKLNTNGLTAVLKDSYLKTTTAIDLSATTTINFSVDGNGGSSDANRFSIVFAKTKAVQIIDTKQGYTIAPNPVENSVMNLQLKNQPAGKYAVRILSNAGQGLLLKNIVHTGGTATQSINLPSGIARGTYQVEITSPAKTTTVQQLMVNER